MWCGMAVLYYVVLCCAVLWYGVTWCDVVWCGVDDRLLIHPSLQRASSNVPYLLFSHPDSPPTTQPPTSAGIVCGSLRCEHFSTCQIIQGVHTCVCPSLCPQDTLMMCGSDGKTYDNECALKRTSCLAGRIISIVRIGVCRKLNTQLAICLSFVHKKNFIITFYLMWFHLV